MRWLALAALVVAAGSIAAAGVSGCLAAEAPDGLLTCSDVPGRLCPQDYYCAPDKTCWHNGHEFHPPPDMTRFFPQFNFDFAQPLPSGDMAMPIDMPIPSDDLLMPPSDLSSSD